MMILLAVLVFGALLLAGLAGIYLEFKSVEPHLFGFNGETFA